MFLDNIKTSDNEFNSFDYISAINNAIDEVQKDKFGMLNKLSEDILSEGLFDKNESKDKIKKKTINLLYRERDRQKKAEKYKNSKEQKIVNKKIVPLLAQKKKYLTGKYQDADFRDEKVQKEFKSDMGSVFQEVFSVDFSDTEGITEAILIFLIILAVQSFILSILTLFMGGTVAMIILAVFVAPVFEELGKNYSIKRDNIGNFVFIFNVGETLTYIFGHGASLLIRIPAIILHYTTSLIQTKIIREDEENDKIALVAGAIVHAIFNLTASFI